MKKKNAWILAMSLACALLTACRSTGPRQEVKPTKENADSAPAGATLLALTNRLQPEWLAAPTNLFTLGPGDLVEIELIGDPSTRQLSLVGPDGRLYYYLLPGLDVWGLTLRETKALLEREVAKLVKGEDRVSLTLRAVESKRVWLLGRLNQPGVHSLSSPITLLEAISLAGGPATMSSVASPSTAAGHPPGPPDAAESADLRRSFVIRHGQFLPVNFERLLNEGDLTQNIYLEADDLVYLPTAAAREVYVLGAVGQPQSVPFTQGMSVVQAMAMARGTIKDAYLSHVAIVRGSLVKPDLIVVDYGAIVKGRQPDVPLRSSDIVYVPFSPYRTLTRYAELILTTFVRTVGANEGARAVSRGAVPIGVNVPIGF